MPEKEKPQEQANSASAVATDVDVVGAATDNVANSSTRESLNETVETGKAVDLIENQASSSTDESLNDTVETGKAVDFSENQQDIDTDGEDEQDNVKQGRCSQWMNHHRLGWLASLPGIWPRTFSLIFGVIIPLFLLILVSMFFGYGLAKLEAPMEFEANNAILANRALVHTTNNFQGNVSQELPRICLSLYALNSTGKLNATLLEEEVTEIFLQVITRAVEHEQRPDNDTSVDGITLPENITASELLEFMNWCGKFGITLTKRFAALEGVNHNLIGEDLTFNWIRCDTVGNSSGSLLDQVWGRPYLNRTQLKPDVQAAGAVSRWRLNAAELYNETLVYIGNTTSTARASIAAYVYAVENANGFDHCYPNSAASAWFWFTVMTTIGYGNQAPATEGGRAMIYTLGFLSILMFAVILGTAGTIITTIFDDFINRTKLHHFNISWVACLFWGFCYYAWMLAIAAVTQNWKETRLGDDMEFSEAYWFSYISTTTVGLGDYYLEPDVILREDLITFPLMFLTGFVLLANFFVKLTEVLTSLVPSNRKSLEDILIESKVPCMPENVKKGIKIITDVTHAPEKVKKGIKIIADVTHTSHLGRRGGETRGESNNEIANEQQEPTPPYTESVPLDAEKGGNAQ